MEIFIDLELNRIMERQYSCPTIINFKGLIKINMAHANISSDGANPVGLIGLKRADNI